jgi:hypothetical protein
MTVPRQHGRVPWCACELAMLHHGSHGNKPRHLLRRLQWRSLLAELCC